MFALACRWIFQKGMFPHVVRCAVLLRSENVKTQKWPETQLLAAFGEIKFPDGRAFGSVHLFDKQPLEKIPM